MTLFTAIWVTSAVIFTVIGLVILNCHRLDRKQFVTPATIHPVEIEQILNHGWDVWRCEITMSDGSEREAYVQGDGHVFAESTIEFID